MLHISLSIGQDSVGREIAKVSRLLLETVSMRRLFIISDYFRIRELTLVAMLE
jgi:hypothetical protein